MRKLLFVFCMAAMIAACGENKNRSGMNSEENAEENAGEVVTPMEDSASMQMDTTQQQMDTIR